MLVIKTPIGSDVIIKIKSTFSKMHLLNLFIKSVQNNVLLCDKNVLLQQQATSSWWCIPFSALERVKMAGQFPKVSSYGDPLTDIFFLVFNSCCPLSGHRRTGFLIPNDRPLSSFTFLTTPFILSSNSKPFFYLSYLSLLLIFMLLLIFFYIYLTTFNLTLAL